MLAKTFKITVPKAFLQLGVDQEQLQRQVPEWIVLSLFTQDRISSGKAARLLNISRVEFLALLRNYGIPYLDYTTEELDEEFAAVDAMETKKKE